MFRFEQPSYLYLLLLIPLLALLHYATNHYRRKRLMRYGDPDLLKELMPDISVMRREVKTWLMLIAMALLIVALARPQFGTKVDTRKRQGIEAIIAMDISNSMLAEDVTPSRLDKSKMLVAQKDLLEMSDYDISSVWYEKLLSEQDYQIYKDVWDRVNYGDVTLTHINGIFNE